MEKFKQLSQVFATMPLAAQIFVGAFLFAFAAASVYSRINLEFGSKTFSGVSEETLRKDWKHILVYTGIPVILFVWYGALLATFYLG